LADQRADIGEPGLDEGVRRELARGEREREAAATVAKARSVHLKPVLASGQGPHDPAVQEDFDDEALRPVLAVGHEPFERPRA
jgi:hypothetical protein